MKSIAIFNNKGGVGKSTLTYHLGYALSEMNKKVLMIDLDPQSNLSLFTLKDEEIETIWNEEDSFIEDYSEAKKNLSDEQFSRLHLKTRSIHYILKPTEDGQSDEQNISPPIKINDNLFLIPGRLTLHTFEDKLAQEWSRAFIGKPEALRVVAAIRRICNEYSNRMGFDIILLDTSPSLGILNKIIISNSDGFIIPCSADVFSGYGIKNIGNALKFWKKEFDTMMALLQDNKKENMPNRFVKLLGYTIYNAQKRSDAKNELRLAQAHYNWAKLLPENIIKYIPNECYAPISKDDIKSCIGNNSIIYGHATRTETAQKEKKPIWLLPAGIAGITKEYQSEIRDKYHTFASDLIRRLENVDE
ncbi:ParA family protein [Actinobacillus genomosp. 1]|uniref:ParA family protein n=1 Tax=Actinobacillus genomosp. 1 TaxID=254839 RepID=UPI00244221E4|nr:AAA family ATPase [Actinobacillus genomosp. 1]WGE90722.1 AAA family ATPase [Actinobacillus genomosp. 1]